MLVLQQFQLPVHFIQDKNGGSKVKVAYISQLWLVQTPFIFHPDIVQPKY